MDEEGIMDRLEEVAAEARRYKRVLRIIAEAAGLDPVHMTAEEIATAVVQRLNNPPGRGGG